MINIVLKNLINIIFEIGLMVNAFLFIPQAIRIFKRKNSKGVSLLTFGGFWCIQIFIFLHAIIQKDWWLGIGSILGLITCGINVFFILKYRKSN